MGGGEITEHLLDILAQFGGGRGDPGNVAVRFLLASFFWALLLGFALWTWKRERRRRDRVIAAAAAIGLFRELLMFGAYEVGPLFGLPLDAAHFFYPPLEHAISQAASVTMGFAALYYFAGWRRLGRIYIRLGLAAALLLYVVTAPSWYRFLGANPAARFGLFPGDLAFRLTGCVFSGLVLVGLFATRGRRPRSIHVALLAAFFGFFLDDFLMLFNLLGGDVQREFYAPIRHNLHIWAIPLLTFVYWREEQSRSDAARTERDALLAHMENVREGERARIAREMHDELGQTLTAAKMNLQWMLRHMNGESSGISEKTDIVARLVDDSIRSVKRLCTELRPSILDDLGLPAALEWQTAEFTRRFGIACRLRCRPESFPVDPEVATAVFRIVQELLTNVARHADANFVEVNVNAEKGLIAAVMDNGRGIPAGDGRPGGFGLIGIRERVRFLGGQLSIAATPGLGTTVTVRIPDRRGAKAPRKEVQE